MPKETVYCRVCSVMIPGPEAEGDLCRTCREKGRNDTSKAVSDRVALNLKTRLENELTAVEERLAHAEAAARHLEGALHVYDNSAEPRRAKGAGALGELGRRIAVALDGTLRGVTDAEKRCGELERDLEKNRGELSNFRAREQNLREARLHMLQARHLSGDLGRRVEHVHALLHALGGAVPDPTKPKSDAELHEIEKLLDADEQAAARTIRETELRISHSEDKLAEARTALASHRAAEQHLRAMDMQLWQARQLAEDLDRNLTAVSGTLKTLRERTQALLADSAPAPREERPAAAQTAPAPVEPRRPRVPTP